VDHDPEEKHRAVERLVNRRLPGIRDSADPPDGHAAPGILIEIYTGIFNSSLLVALLPFLV
jgi:hypothetical protein